VGAPPTSGRDRSREVRRRPGGDGAPACSVDALGGAGDLGQEVAAELDEAGVAGALEAEKGGAVGAVAGAVDGVAVELVAPGGRPGRPGGLLRARGGARARLLGLGGGGRAGDGEACGEGERGGERRERPPGALLRSRSAR